MKRLAMTLLFSAFIAWVRASDDFATSAADTEFDRLKYKILYPNENPVQREAHRKMDNLHTELQQAGDAQKQKADRKASELIKQIPTEDPIETRLNKRMNNMISTNSIINTNWWTNTAASVTNSSIHRP